MKQSLESRRYDVDWLRALAFFLLIFYHMGMYYVADWEWHVKSQYQSEFLQNVMLFSNQWRMPLLFLLSGISLRLIETKISTWRLFKLRFVRLSIPLIIGMYLIVPPQLYFELQQSFGFDGSYWQFMSFYVNPATSMYPQKHYGMGLLTWNHLWYLAYLWVYTLLYILLRPLFQGVGNWVSTRKPPILLIVIIPVVCSVLIAIALHQYPRTNAMIADWHNHADYFAVLLWGYLLAASPHSWTQVIKARYLCLFIGCLGYWMVLGFHKQTLIFPQSGIAEIVKIFVHSTNAVAWMLCVIGFSGVYLNKPSRVVSYLNEAVLPWYIVHQTVIILIAMALLKYDLGPIIEPVLLMLATFLICFLIYEGTRRNKMTRFIFGMKSV